MKIEVRPKDYSENDKNQSFTECCTVIVKTTDDSGNTSETEENGCIIQGEEMIYLNAPKIYPSKDTPLLTEAPDIIGAINEVFLLGSGDDDWQPPADWLPIPEPEEYDIYVLVWVTNTDNNFNLELANNNGEDPAGTFSFDWGDGTVTSIPYPGGDNWTPSISHIFEKTGQYLIKIVVPESYNVLHYQRTKNCYWQIIKTGSGVQFYSDYIDNNASYNRPLSDHLRLKYIKVNHAKGLPFDKENYYFEDDNALRKITLQKKMSGDVLDSCFQFGSFSNFEQISFDSSATTQIGRYGFRGCKLLKRADFPNCVSVGNYAFADCSALTEINLPNCTLIGDNAFSGCINLQKITVADGCTYGSGCFQSCYSLFPRPDGSVN